MNPALSGSTRITPEEIVRELQEIEAEYEELEREADEMLHIGNAQAASRFFMDFLVSRYREITGRYRKVSRLITRYLYRDTH